NWGDGTSHTMFSASTAGSLGTRTHTYGEEGGYTVTVTVTDTADGQSDSKSFQVAVSDPPVVGAQANVSAIAGAPFNGTVATFTDPGGPEPNAFDPAPGIAAHYNATIK